MGRHSIPDPDEPGREPVEPEYGDYEDYGDYTDYTADSDVPEAPGGVARFEAPARRSAPSRPGRRRAVTATPASGPAATGLSPRAGGASASV